MQTAKLFKNGRSQAVRLRVLDWMADEGSAVSDTPAQRGRGKLAQERTAPYDIREAVAQARTVAPKSARKSRPGGKPKAK